MHSYGFADGFGNEITRGWQGWEAEARAFAQRLANERRVAVDFWIEGDPSVDDGPCNSLETVEPE